MTRLVESDIEAVVDRIMQLDHYTKKYTGKGLFEIACEAADLTQAEADQRKEIKMALVPITMGEGIIPGFSETLKGILQFLEVPAYVTRQMNVDGIYDAYCNAQGQMYADDDRFIAIHNRTGKVSDNGSATGRGFAYMLYEAAGGVKGKKTVVLGLGPVGLAAAVTLHHLGADLYVYDCNEEKYKNLPEYMKVDREALVHKYDCILEATTAPNTVTMQMLNEHTVVAAPGMPLGTTSEVTEYLSAHGRLFHNVLELGTMVMMMDILKK